MAVQCEPREFLEQVPEVNVIVGLEHNLGCMPLANGYKGFLSIYGSRSAGSSTNF